MCPQKLQKPHPTNMNDGTDSSLLENHTFNSNNNNNYDLMDIAMNIINPFTPFPCPSSLPPETLIHLQSPATATTMTTLFSDQSNNVNTHQIGDQRDQEPEEEEEELDAMKELTYVIAATQPVDIDPLNVPKPKRRNVRISDDPQTVVARRRRERIAEKIRVLRRLVPGGEKMDIASMLDEAARYAKFLERWICQLQSIHSPPPPPESAASAGDPEGAYLRSLHFPV